MGHVAAVLMVLLTRSRDLVKDVELARLVPSFPQLVETIMKVFFYGIVPRVEPASTGVSLRRRSRGKQ